MRRIIEDTKGVSYITTALLILVFTTLFAAVFSFSKTMTVLTGVKAEAGKALDSCVIENAKIIYSSIKQGHNRTGTIGGISFTERFMNETGAVSDGEGVSVINGKGDTVYRLSEPVVDFDEDNVLRIKVDFTVEVPLKLFGVELFDVSIPMCVKSKYVNFLIE